MTVNLTINEEVCKKHNLTISDVLLMCLYNLEDKPSERKDFLLNNGYITSFNLQKEFAVTNEGDAVISTILLESDPNLDKERDYVSLAKQLKELFPQGKKQGTNMYWTEGIPLIIKRLKLFFKKYDYDNSITDEQIIKATEKYIASFNGNFHFMKLLKYFIFKEKKGDAGEIESESELLTYMENANQVEDTQQEINWDVELR